MKFIKARIAVFLAVLSLSTQVSAQKEELVELSCPQPSSIETSIAGAAATGLAVSSSVYLLRRSDFARLDTLIARDASLQQLARLVSEEKMAEAEYLKALNETKNLPEVGPLTKEQSRLVSSRNVMGHLYRAYKARSERALRENSALPPLKKALESTSLERIALEGKMRPWQRAVRGGAGIAAIGVLTLVTSRSDAQDLAQAIANEEKADSLAAMKCVLMGLINK